MSVVALGMAAPAHGAFGELDPAFGDGGISVVDCGVADPGNQFGTQLTAVDVRGDGTIAVAGTCTTGAVAGRLTAAGRPDPGFNGGQLARIELPDWGTGGTSVAFDAQGRVVLAGHAVQYDPSYEGNLHWQLLLARFGVDGELDPSFGTDGILRSDAPGALTAWATAMELSPDGHIVVTGGAGGYGQYGASHVFAARFDADARSADASFEGDGWAIRDELGDVSSSVDVLPDERVVVAGEQVIGSAFVRRFRSDGGIDDSFGRYGTGASGFGQDTTFTGVRALPDGRLLGAGGAGVISILPNGLEDPAYDRGAQGVTGIYSQFAVPVGTAESYDLTGLAVDAGGRALLSGRYTTDNGHAGDVLVAALDGSGFPSRALGGSPPGMRRIAIPGYGWTSANAIALGPDGRLLVAGAARRAVADVNTGLVARLQPDLPPAAALTAPAQARVGQAVTFDASGSSDPEGALFRFVWDFDGDGRDDADSGARPTASHTFARPGRVTARVRVIDEAGSTAPASAVLTVGEATGGGESAGNVAPNRVIVRVLSGRVRVRRPGAARFSRLSGRVSVPFRTEIDARKGVVRLTVAAAAGGTDSARAWSGRFRLYRAAGTTLTLTGALPRRLWTDAKGRFRVRGHYATAAARNAAWLVGDRRAGTRVRVRRGRATVRALTGRRTARVVRAGHGLLVRR